MTSKGWLRRKKENGRRLRGGRGQSMCTINIYELMCKYLNTHTHTHTHTHYGSTLTYPLYLLLTLTYFTIHCPSPPLTYLPLTSLYLPYPPLVIPLTDLYVYPSLSPISFLPLLSSSSSSSSSSSNSSCPSLHAY